MTDTNSRREDDRVQLFDPNQELFIGEHSRPHWAQDGTITFITMRLADSIPREVIQRWDRERLEFLARHGIACDDWRVGYSQLSKPDAAKFSKHFRRLREDKLDECLGKCVLRNQEAAKIVSDSLRHFDNERYLLGDFVIMPNHIHLLAVFPHADAMEAQCTSWMRFTATKINQLNGQKGALWQSEPFDHLVRSIAQLEYLRDYIKQNPTKARLPDEDFYYQRSNRLF